jgi:hypothetical protein
MHRRVAVRPEMPPEVRTPVVGVSRIGFAPAFVLITWISQPPSDDPSMGNVSVTLPLVVSMRNVVRASLATIV